MIKILFSDLDGTLLVNGSDHSGRVTCENMMQSLNWKVVVFVLGL